MTEKKIDLLDFACLLEAAPLLQKFELHVSLSFGDLDYAIHLCKPINLLQTEYCLSGFYMRFFSLCGYRWSLTLYCLLNTIFCF